MRGANCWADHRMVRAKLKLQLPRSSGAKDKKSAPFAVHELSTKKRRNEYRNCLENKLQTNTHSSKKSSEDNWTTVKFSLMAAAEETVGRGRR